MEDPTPIKGLNLDPSLELKEAGMREAVSDEFSFVHNRLAPMIWALCFDICRENPSPARLNAVLNSLLTATTAWITAVTPDGSDVDSEHYTVVVGKFQENFAAMLGDHETIRADVSQLGNFQGRQMILEHQNNALAKAVKELVIVLTDLQAGGKEA